MPWPALPDLDFGQSTAVDPSQFVDQISHWALKDTKGHLPGICVAASDTPNDLKQLAPPAFRCDGVDDQVEIQAAIAAFSDVRLLPGTYTISDTIELYDPAQTIRGQGPDRTIIQASAAGAPMFMVEAFNSHTAVSDLTLRGSAIGDGQTGVYMSGFAAQVSRVNFEDLQRGIWGFATGLVTSCIFDDVNDGVELDGVIAVVGCQFQATERRAAWLWSGASLIGCGVTLGTGSTLSGVLVRDLSRVVACYFNMFGTPAVPMIEATSRAAVVGNTIQEAGAEAILVTGNDSVVADNLISRASLAADNTYDAIRVSGDRCSVLGNRVRHEGVAAQARYGLRIDASADRTYAFGNDLYLSGRTGSFSDAGTNTDTTSTNRT